MAYDWFMTNQIGDLIGRKNYSEPPEIQQIKEFVKARIGIVPKVSIRPESYVVSVSSAAAAGTLRIHLRELQELLGAEKKILIRIG
jgi:hypothetical protein